MDQHLDKIRKLLQTHQALANYKAYKDGTQIHLTCNWGISRGCDPPCRVTVGKWTFFSTGNGGAVLSLPAPLKSAWNFCEKRPTICSGKVDATAYSPATNNKGALLLPGVRPCCSNKRKFSGFLPGNTEQRLEIFIRGFKHNIIWQGRCRSLLVPIQGFQVVPQELFIETRLRTALAVLILRPEA